jgi:hypothetical protein
MGLGSELAQRHLRTLQGLALGAKGGVAQAGRRVAWIKAFATGVTAKAAAFASGFTTGIWAGAAVHAGAGIAPTASGVFAVAKFAGTGRVAARGFAFHAGAVVAAHGHHALGRGFGCNHLGCGGGGRAFCAVADGWRGVGHIGLATLFWTGVLISGTFGVGAFQSGTFGRSAFGSGGFGHSGVY